MVASVGLILFILGQGEIKDEFTSIVGIKLNNAEILEYFFWLAWTYFLYRFYIYSKPALTRAKIDWVTSLAETDYRNFAKSKLLDLYSERHIKNGRFVSEDFKGEFSRTSPFPYPEFSLIGTKLKYDKKIGGKSFGVLEQNIEINISTLKALSFMLDAIRRYFFKESFTDFVCPTLIALYTFFLGAFSYLII